MKPKLIIVTGNPLKFRQLEYVLSKFFDCIQGSVDGYEIQGTAEEILNFKLSSAYEKYQCPVIVEDTALYFEVLGGFPGPYIRDFLSVMEPWRMSEKFEGGRVRVGCMIGICFDNNNIIIGKGEVNGTVVKSNIVEHGGREFDIFVLPDGKEKVMFEYTPEEVTEFSHRGNAIRDLISKLSNMEK